MTERVDPDELSGLLDGVLSAQRAAQIVHVMGEDRRLHAEFDELARLDGIWYAAAAQAVFQPRVFLPQRRKLTVGLLAKAATAAGLVLGVRFLPKLASSFTLSVAANAALLVLILTGFIILQRRADDSRPEHSLVGGN
jgi:hypothetical protein